jgi:hypothetical protein
MKRDILGIVVALLMALTVAHPAPSQAQAWSELRPAGEGFRAEMPGQPKINKSRKESDIVFEASVGDGNPAFYYLTYTQYAQPLDPPSAVFARIRAVEKPLEGERDISVAGHPGREYVMRSKETWMIKRMVLVRNRLYQIIVGSNDKAIVMSPDARRFLDSFRLI